MQAGNIHNFRLFYLLFYSFFLRGIGESETIGNLLGLWVPP